MSALGEEIRMCPHKPPGTVAAVILITFGAALGLLLLAVSLDSAASSNGDLVFLAVLSLSCLAPGTLLLWRRRRKRREGLVVRIFERGVVRETASARQELAFADTAEVRAGPAPDGRYVAALLARDGTRLELDSEALDNVDATLPVLLEKLRGGAAFARGVERFAQEPAGPAPVDFASKEPASQDFPGAPVLGAGMLELRRDAVRIQAHQAPTMLPQFAGAIVGLLGITAVAIVLSALDVEPAGAGMGKLLFVLGLAFGIAPGVLVYEQLRRRLRGGGVDVAVPWSAVRVLSRDGESATLRLVWPDLRGDVMVRPADDVARALVLALPLESAATPGADRTSAA